MNGRERRRETAQLYSEMYDRGYSPSRGLGIVFVPFVALMILSVFLLITVVLALAGFMPATFSDFIHGLLGAI